MKNAETGMRAGGIPQDRPRLFHTPKLHCSLHGLQLVPFHAKKCEGPSNSIAHPTPRSAAGPLRTLVPNPQVYRTSFTCCWLADGLAGAARNAALHAGPTQNRVSTQDQDTDEASRQGTVTADRRFFLDYLCGLCQVVFVEGDIGRVEEVASW